jgi:hypothetical protein
VEVAPKELRAAIPLLGVDLQFVEVSGPPGFAEAFAAILREQADALFVFPDPLTFGHRESIAGFANNKSASKPIAAGLMFFRSRIARAQFDGIYSPPAIKSESGTFATCRLHRSICFQA